MRTCRFLHSVLLLLAFVLGGGQYMNEPASAGLVGQPDQVTLADMGTAGHPKAADCAMCANEAPDKPICLPTCVGVQVVLPGGPTASVDMTLVRLGLPADERLDSPAVQPDPPPPRLSILV